MDAVAEIDRLETVFSQLEAQFEKVTNTDENAKIRKMVEITCIFA